MSDNYKLSFLENSSHKILCPRCKKIIHDTEESKMYEKLDKHLKNCKTKIKLK